MSREASETKSLRALTRQVPPRSVGCAPDRCRSNDTRFEDYRPRSIQDHLGPAEMKLRATEPAARSPHWLSASRSAAPAWTAAHAPQVATPLPRDRKSTRLNSSHRCISYAVFCLKKKITTNYISTRQR